MLNYAEACERNKAPIFATLNEFLPETGACTILEIGSGSGQHAINLTRHRPNWQWQTTEMTDYISALRENISHYASALPSPQTLNVNDLSWPFEEVGFAFTSNTLHIMDESSVESFFKGLSKVLVDKGLLFIYGPFRYQGEFTSASNGDFDLWLKSRNPKSGIRDFEWIQELAQKANLSLRADQQMPANNQLLVWQKGTYPYRSD